jgi:hypothetical protein
MVDHPSSFQPSSLTSVANFFGNRLHGIDLRFQRLIRMGALAVIWALWLCRNDKKITKIILFCRLSTDVPIFYICGRLFSGWRIAISLRRSVHDWRLLREIRFPYMDDRIICGLVLLLRLRRFTFYRYYMYSAFSFISWILRGFLNGIRLGVIACL